MKESGDAEITFKVIFVNFSIYVIIFCAFDSICD